MRVELAPAAEEDIDRIGRHIGLDNPDRAETFTAEILAACRALGSAPLAYPAFPNRRHLRRRVFRAYLIIYRPTPRVVEIVRVLHGSRDIDRILASGEP